MSNAPTGWVKPHLCARSGASAARFFTSKVLARQDDWAICAFGRIIKKFDNTGEDVDDLISIGTVGLIKAIDTYDLNKGTRLATYAARCIENEILMHLRAAKRIRSEVSLYDPIGIDREGNEITLIDVLGSDPDVVPDQVADAAEVKDILRRIGTLGEKERKVLVLRFGLNHDRKRTQREIARLMGISRSYVSRIEKRAIEAIRQSQEG